jgi:hypothetical protein
LRSAGKPNLTVRVGASILLTIAALATLAFGGFHVIRHRATAAAVVPYPHDLGQVSFAVAGDVIPHQAVREAAASAGADEAGWQALFSDVSDVFKNANSKMRTSAL